jgi:hypothetical protein
MHALICQEAEELEQVAAAKASSAAKNKKRRAKKKGGLLSTNEPSTQGALVEVKGRKDDSTTHSQGEWETFGDEDVSIFEKDDKGEHRDMSAGVDVLFKEDKNDNKEAGSAQAGTAGASSQASIPTHQTRKTTQAHAAQQHRAALKPWDSDGDVALQHRNTILGREPPVVCNVKHHQNQNVSDSFKSLRVFVFVFTSMYP